MKRILCVLLFVFGLLTSAWADSSRYASESVLNSGKWVKIQVAEDGIYKLTAADLKKMGFSNLDKVVAPNRNRHNIIGFHLPFIISCTNSNGQVYSSLIFKIITSFSTHCIT